MNEIVKIINCMAGRYQPRQIFQDWIKMFALSMSNSFYFDNKLENEYLDIAKKYTNDQLNMFSEMSARLVMLFDEEISDYLGEIYMMLGASSVKTAQFFTPFHVSELMAEAVLTKWDMKKIIFLLIYNRVVDKMKVVYPFYESVIIKKPKKVNV